MYPKINPFDSLCIEIAHFLLEHKRMFLCILHLDFHIDYESRCKISHMNNIYVTIFADFYELNIPCKMA